MKSNSVFQFGATDALFEGYPLYHYTGTTGSTITMTGSFANSSSNVITFNYLANAALNTFVFSNSIIQFTTANGDVVSSGVKSVDGNNIIITDSIWLAFNNVAYATANAGSNVINITSLTNSFDIVNDGIYSNTMYPLKDIIRAGDTILVNNMTQTVSSVNYIQDIVYLNSNLTYGANGLLSVSRTYNTNNVQIFGPIGSQYTPELTTEDGRSLTDEQNNILVLG
jgi:hypothetical protein